MRHDITTVPHAREATLTFLGAADTVTGSRYLVTTPASRVLVDCGLFQGYKVLRARNRAPFPVAPGSIDAVVLTHAHLDHSGYLPALVRDGFRGRVFASEGTIALCRIMLLDSAHLLEEEARHASKHGWSRHERPQPLYTVEDAARSLEQFTPLAEGTEVAVAPGVRAMIRPAGHILGAMSVYLDVDGRRVCFSGDLGRPDDPLMRAPHPFEGADVLVAESTYGNRAHTERDPEEQLADIVRRTARRNGVVLIPAFAVGRTETVLLHLTRLLDRGEIPNVPIYVNSPMAISVADVYQRHASEHRLSQDEFTRLYKIATPVRSVDESKLLNLRGGPMIIISASGMLTGGRILHHLQAYGADPRNSIVLTGFQAGGTRGARLLAGERTLRIFGKEIAINADVVSIGSMSAHADAAEVLNWMRPAPRVPYTVYVTHGEPAAADALRLRVERELGWRSRVPEHGEVVPLGAERGTA
ncbi:MBL fold metallo-hydrolase [Microbacterium sp. SD291]|uniref:MBL fold metallo-hydrolase n=1 Tax=Microbacterium sp. SD291 TaxID=2782007 RepID=UPI001A974F97|nr:MBL fold metallo-hydrolase [Microbacterium sp. SD291]MBO0982179.1 MBL fold metallo-hydrolase [Microbacterium sp. SD291]